MSKVLQKIYTYILCRTFDATLYRHATSHVSCSLTFLAAVLKTICYLNLLMTISVLSIPLDFRTFFAKRFNYVTHCNVDAVVEPDGRVIDSTQSLSRDRVRHRLQHEVKK